MTERMDIEPRSILAREIAHGLYGWTDEEFCDEGDGGEFDRLDFLQMADIALNSVAFKDHVAEAVADERKRVGAALEAERLRNPMNGDGSNYMLDKVIKRLDRVAGDATTSMAARWERARLDDIDEARDHEFYGYAKPITTHTQQLREALSDSTEAER